MSQTKDLIDLIKIGYHSDDETGLYSIGELDFGICAELNTYLEKYGAKGKDGIIRMLAYLIYEIEHRFRTTKEKEIKGSQEIMNKVEEVIEKLHEAYMQKKGGKRLK